MQIKWSIMHKNPKIVDYAKKNLFACFGHPYLLGNYQIHEG